MQIEALQEKSADVNGSSDAANPSPDNGVHEVNLGPVPRGGVQREEQAKAFASGPAEAKIRGERIQAIQNAIADGTYDVSASEVASKLMAQMLKNQGESS